MNAVTTTPELCSTEQADYRELEALLDAAPPIAKVMTLAILELSWYNNNAGEHVRQRLNEAVQKIAGQIGTVTGEPDDLVSQWLALLAGLRHGRQQ